MKNTTIFIPQHAQKKGLNNEYLILFLWVGYFSLSVCLALIFQNIVVPNIASIHGEGKLLANDAVHFDNLAWGLAQEIRQIGWQAWRLYVDYSAPGNVGILAALYALGGHDPSLVVPINSALHALSGIMIFLISLKLTGNRWVGIYAGLVSSALFVVFPSSLSWYGQLHKDSYSIAGTLLLLWSWVRVISKEDNDFSYFSLILVVTLAAALIGIVRPYLLLMQLAMALISFIIVLCLGGIYRNNEQFKEKVKAAGVIVCILFLAVSITHNYAYKVSSGTQASQTIIDANGQVIDWSWQYTDILPVELEKYIAGLAKTRAVIINNDINIQANSTMDSTIVPSNMFELLKYLPRAFSIGVLAPFPNMWFQDSKVTRLLSSFEMLIYYLFIPGIVFLLINSRKPEVYYALFFSLAFLTVLGLTMANLGTLYRMRYGYLFILLLLGAIGWGCLLKKMNVGLYIKKLLMKNMKPVLLTELSADDVKPLRKATIYTSAMVISVTLIGFVGFYFRDWLLAHSLGVNRTLDLYFISLIIPMSLVNIFCIPIGVAFTPMFINLLEKSNKEVAKKLLSEISGRVIFVLLLFSLLLCIFLPNILYFVFSFNIDNLEFTEKMMIYMSLSILFFSGSLVLGNACLNVIGKASISSLAQLIVPVTAVISIVCFSKYIGVVSAVIGMCLGQLLNLLIIEYFLIRNGYSLLPTLVKSREPLFVGFWASYFPLVIAAMFAGAVLLLNTSLASSFNEGAVSVFTLGNKIVLLVTGLMNVAITSVFLPYISRLISKSHIDSARKEIALFLVGLTILTALVSIILFAWAHEIVRLLFGTSNISENELSILIDVMKYSLVQIPFSVSSMLLIKFAIASKHSLVVLFVTSFGLVMNYFLTLAFFDFLGTPGIAIGLSLSFIVVATLLVFTLSYLGHFVFSDVLIVMLLWLLFLTSIVCINFMSVSGIFCVCLAFSFLIYGYLKSFTIFQKQRLMV